MDDLTIHGPSGYATDKYAPVDYFKGQDKRARRFTLYRGTKQVLFFDYFIVDDTRYVLYVEVNPAFREGKWLEIAAEIQANPDNHLNQKRVVWLKVSPWLAKAMPNILTTIDKLNEKDITFIKSAYIEGAINEIHSFEDNQ